MLRHDITLDIEAIRLLMPPRCRRQMPRAMPLWRCMLRLITLLLRYAVTRCYC